MAGVSEMLDRQLTEDEDAPYKKLYRLSIPEHAAPPIPTDPPEDTVQALYPGHREVLVSFDPTVLEWYPSVVILLPQRGLFEYLLDELLDDLGEVVEDEVIRVTGDHDENTPVVWTEPVATTDVTVATYATETGRRLTLEYPLPDTKDAKADIRRWIATDTPSPR